MVASGIVPAFVEVTVLSTVVLDNLFAGLLVVLGLPAVLVKN